MGKIAFVDLSDGSVRIDETPQADLRAYLGGRGLGAVMLARLTGPATDPLGPENVLVFTTGLLTGSPWPASSRMHVTFKSPLTGAYGYANCGGHVGPELRHAGFDAVVVSGRAPEPSILEITGDGIAVRPAPELWGKTAGQADAALRGAKPGREGGHVACIGPAGENLVRIAAIITDRHRAAARGGPGAVMGSKQLKAIHVRAGRRPTWPRALAAAAGEAARKLGRDTHIDGLRRDGTLTLMDPKNASGDQPAKNHQLVQVPFIKQVNAAAFERYSRGRKGCYACPVRCSRYSVVDEGPYAVDMDGPEYETTNALGPMCWVSDPEAILYANHLCNEYGLDTISTGVTVAFAMELHQRGLLNDETLSLEWGDADTLVGLIERIAYRCGVGQLLAEGTRRAAAQIGGDAPRYAMQVKGMEMPRQEPRFAKGFGLGHATSNRGADHLYAMPAIDLAGAWDTARRLFPAEIVTELMDPANEKYKPDMVVYGEHFCALTDALGICKFTTVEEYSLLPEDLAAGASAILGDEVTGPELLLAGERIVNLERLYNVRLGLSRADDLLPERFSGEPANVYSLEDGPDAPLLRTGVIHDLPAMLDRYYSLRGWDADGVPTPETLERLQLDGLK